MSMNSPTQAPSPVQPPTEPLKPAAAKVAAPAGPATSVSANSSNAYDIQIIYARHNAPAKIAAKVLIGIALVASMYFAWQHAKPSDQPAQTNSVVADNTASPLDHVAATPAPAELRLVRRQFAVRDHQAFPFVVPAHIVSPHIHGEFHTLAGGTLDVLLMKEEDYKEFAQNHSSEAAFSQPGSSGGTIDWAMPPTLLDPQKYYLVFSNILGDGPITVKADFSVDF